jgi:peptidoglycan/xylan/chitin deacetylase (PgdA/CDA1 family)
VRIPGTRTLRTARHWARTRFSRRALILGYHRIANAESDPFDMCTPPARFDAQVRWLRSEAEPLSLGEAVSALSEDRLPRRGVVVTLDDGYADSLHAARPVLEAHGVPATVFVTVGILGREPWWDTLERTVRNAPEAPRSLRIDPFLSWNAGSAAGASARDSLVHASHRVLADLGEAERDDLLERLAVALGAADGAGATARGLAEEELRQLARTRARIRCSPACRWSSNARRSSGADDS